MQKADIYPIVCGQKRHVRVAFFESDGLRQGKAEESKGEEKTWFVLSFCPSHNGLYKLKDVNTADAGRKKAPHSTLEHGA